MQYEYTRRRGRRSSVTDAVTFRVARLRRGALGSAPAADVSDLIDRTYDYHSPRELRWHLADRLGLTPSDLTLSETA